MENDYEIDLTQLDSVRENLNGFWIPENQLDSENIIWFDFHKKKNSSIWRSVPKEKTESYPIFSCPTLVILIKVNGKTAIEYINLGGSDTTKIEYLSKTKFKIDGNTYLKHKGYEF